MTKSRFVTSYVWPISWLVIWYAFALILTAASGENEYRLALSLGKMTWNHPFGFDTFGRDLLETTLRASVTSTAFALGTTAAASIIGVVVGASIAVTPAILRVPVLRVVEGFLAFPSLLFALTWAAMRGPGWDSLTFALLIGLIPSLIRLIHVRTKEILVQDYILAARSLGAGPLRIVWGYLIPPAISLCAVKVPNLFAQALIAESTLTFLGIGAPAGHDTWGSLLLQGKDYLVEAPHLAWGAGLPLVLTVLSLQVLSERLSRSHKST